MIISHTTGTSSPHYHYHYYSSATSSGSSNDDENSLLNDPFTWGDADRYYYNGSNNIIPISTKDYLHSLADTSATQGMKGMMTKAEGEDGHHQLLYNNNRQRQNRQERQKSNSKPYLRGNTTICAACYRTYSEDGTTSCYSKIIMQQQQQQRRRKNDNESFTFIDAARMIGQRDEEKREGGICSLVCHPDYCHEYLYPGLAMAAITPAAAAAEAVAADDIDTDDDDDDNNDDKVSSYCSKYWRYDTVGPAYTNPRTVYFSSSIPDAKRIPPARFRDIETYLSERYDEIMSKQQQQHQQRQGLEQSSSVISLDTFVEYNPSIVQIPYHMLANLPDGTAYLLSARITSANNCFRESMYNRLSSDIRDAIYNTNHNYLGLALLNEQLKVVTNVRTGTKYEIVIDLERNLGLHRTSTASGGGPVFMDYRLFALNDNIYLHANMDTVVVSRLSLSTSSSRSGTKNENNSTQDVIRNCVDIASEYGDKCWDSACRLQNLYSGSNSNDNSDYDDDGLQVTLMRQFNTIWSGGKGKNYALFAIPKTNNNNNNNTTTKNHKEEEDVYVEINIFPNHQVQQILPDTHDIITKQTLWDRLWFPGSKKSRKCNIDCLNLRQVREVGNITSNGSSSTSMVLQPSYYTIDAHEDWFPGSAAPFKESAHGGACCVHFTPSELNIGGSKTNHTQSLLVGVGHTKVTWKPWYSNTKTSQARKDRIPHTHYVSLFYAFDNYPPFTVRAKSGYFCLGHAALLFNTTTTTTNDDEGDYNPYSSLTRNRPLRQNNVTFDCPQISFISSFIEKKKKKEEMSDDDTTLSSSKSSSTIIGYGLNDCTGRLVEVKKSEIMRLLYPDPMDMLFEVIH